MSLNRKFIAAQVTETGIDDAGITAIMNAHQSVVQGLKDDLQTAQDDLKKAQLPPETDWEKKYNDEVTAHDETKKQLEEDLAAEKTAHTDTKNSIAAEKDNATVDGLVAKLLGTADEDGVAMPTHGDAETLLCIFPDVLDGALTFHETSWEMPHAHDGVMTHAARRVVQI